jgi:ribosomal protein S18 acetylase RimI-like enzyme
MTASGPSPTDLRPRELAIRRAGRGDVHDIAQLWERAGLPPSRRGFRNEIARLRRRDPELILIAMWDAQLVGAIAGSYDGRTAVVSRLAVDGRVRRRGVGRHLVGALREQLAGLGAQDDELVVLDGGERADAFWQALGFERGDPSAYVVRDRNRAVKPSGRSPRAAPPRRPRR